MFTSSMSVGLDVGSQSIKLVGLQRQRDIGNLKVFGQIATPPGTVENGLINNPEEVGNELGKLVEKLKLKGSKTESALSGQQVYTRLMTLPAMRPSEMRTAALYQSTSFLPISVDDITADVYPVREFDDPQGKMAELFFVAARKTQAENMLKACQIAGLKLTRLEIEPLALKTLYQTDLMKNKVSAVINVGAQRSYLSVFQKGTLVFVRSIGFGFSAFLQQISQNEEEKKRLEDLSAEDLDCQNLLRNLIDELIRSLDYFRLQNKEDSITSIILCGGIGRLSGVEAYLSHELSIPVQLGDISKHIKISPKIDAEEKNDLFYDYPIALGLALRGGM